MAGAPTCATDYYGAPGGSFCRATLINADQHQALPSFDFQYYRRWSTISIDGFWRTRTSHEFGLFALENSDQIPGEFGSIALENSALLNLLNIKIIKSQPLAGYHVAEKKNDICCPTRTTKKFRPICKRAKEVKTGTRENN